MKTYLATAAALGVLGATAAPALAQRQAPPEAMAARPITFPAFTEEALPNGLRLIVVEHHGRPVLNLDLYLPAGGAADPAGKPGVASMTAELLTKGTPTRDAKAIAEAIEGVGGSLSAGTDDDDLTVSADVLSDQAELAFDLLSDVALRPAFPETELETYRGQKLSALTAALGQPDAVAERIFAREVYGAHPYGRAETPESVKAITAADLKAFHEANFKPGGALLVVSGDITPARARELALRFFGGWRGAAPTRPAFPAVNAAERMRIVLVHRPGSVQSNLIVGRPALRPDSPDYWAANLANQVLGGWSDSRLFQILRQQKGWTYGAYSSVDRMRDVGVFSATAEVRTEVTDSALAEMIHQLRRMGTETVPADELESAKSYLAGSYPGRFETPGMIANRLAGTRLLGLPAEHLRQYPERIRAVTAAQVQRAAATYFSPDKAVVVVVGDATKVLPKIEGMGPVTLLDVEGKPLERSALEVRASSERFDGSRLAPMKLTYGIMVQGNAFGTSTVELARDGAGWKTASQMAIAAAGMEQKSEMTFGADMAVRSLRSTGSMQGQPTSESLDFANGRVTGSAKLPAQMGGDKTVDAEVVPGTRVPEMTAWLLAVADLAPGKTLTFPAYSVRAGSVQNVTATVGAPEKVTVAAGEFEVFPVTVTGETPQTVYVRVAAPHVMVKMAFPGQPITFELQSMQ